MKGRSGRASGGKIESAMKGDMDEGSAPSEVYAGKGSNVEKEAKERKHGGKAEKKKVKMMGEKSKERKDRTPRKSGGKVGANLHPLSTAHAGTAPKGRKGVQMNP